MEPINDAVTHNIRQLREQRKMSLDALAEATGVSKSMLAQIERGIANPTISTVWKIANGLKIPFTQLVTKNQPDAETISIETIPVLLEDGGRYRNRPLFPYDASRRFEIYDIELDPGTVLEAAAHPKDTQEYLVVSQGEVTVTTGGQTLVANGNQAVRFKADSTHIYQNQTDLPCKLTMIISYGDS